MNGSRTLALATLAMAALPWASAQAGGRISVGIGIGWKQASGRGQPAAGRVGCPGGGLAGGTHHAFRSEGAGFCVFNDIAVAIMNLLHGGRIVRAAVLDLDVHQGDGTANLFHDTPEVLTISVHGRNNFPFRKQVSKLDIDLPDGCPDEPYLAAVERAIEAAIAFAPVTA